MLLYTDELSLYRQPRQASLWSGRGRRQPRLRYGQGKNDRLRLLGLLDACSGRVFAWDYAKITAERLGKRWLEAAASYKEAVKVYIVMDNWPVHFHTKALGPLAQDERIEVLALPTYAPWLKPIEKLWRLLKQVATHAHPWCDDFRRLRKEVMQQLQQYCQGSEEVLRYTGLGH